MKKKLIYMNIIVFMNCEKKCEKKTTASQKLTTFKINYLKKIKVKQKVYLQLYINIRYIFQSMWKHLKYFCK